MSDSLGKPRGDSVLKTLPEETQSQIIDLIKKKGSTYRGVRKLLAAEWGIATNETSLRDFYSWWHMRQRFQNASERGRQLQEMLAADSSISPEQIEAAGQAVFLNEAIETGDTQSFVSVTRLRLAKQAFEAEKRGFQATHALKEREFALREREVNLAREKFQRDTCELFLKWQNDERARSITSSGASNAEKIEQLGQAMFGEDWDR